MDLNSINQNVLRLINNSSEIISFLKEFAVDGAKDVRITYQNPDGTESTKTFPNIAKQVAQISSAVPNAMSKTFYVDAVNGSDSNDGSSAHPFKTIKKAVDSVPIGGHGSIQLVQNQTYFIDSDIYLYNKDIFIYAENSVIENTASVYTIDGTDYTATYGFVPIMSKLMFVYGTIRTADLLTDASGNVLSAYVWQGIIKRNYMIRAFVQTSHVDIKLGDTDFIRRALDSNAIDFLMYQGSVNRVGANQDGYLIANEAGDFRFSAKNNSLGTERDGSTDLTWDSIISGITKDSNGVPRNIISNIVF